MKTTPHDLAKKTLLMFLIILPSHMSLAQEQTGELPKGFVYVDEVIPDIIIELRYYSGHSFVGETVDGYLKPRCILTREAAEALTKVQKALRPFGLGLKVFDAYRPQQAVDHFVRWAKDLDDTRMKQEFYPEVDKRNLFKDGYIASRSSHSRGSTVDLTIVSLQSGGPPKELDMGTGFDFFGPESWPHHSGTPADRRAHRMLLHILMEMNGFEFYPKEWWHFTLKNEPFPESYFNFPIQ